MRSALHFSLVVFIFTSLAKADVYIDFLQSEVNAGKAAIRLSGTFTASGGPSSGGRESKGSRFQFEGSSSDLTGLQLIDFGGIEETYYHSVSLPAISGNLHDITVGGGVGFTQFGLQFGESYTNDGYGFSLSFNGQLDEEDGLTSIGFVTIRSFSEVETINFSDAIIELDFDFANLNPGGQVIFEEYGDQSTQQITITVAKSKSNPNQEALDSANTTGVFIGNANAGATNNIINTITGGLHNGRIVRARSHLINPRLIDTQSWVSADRSLPNYLNFAANQGITMRQALGLEDIPVSSSVAGGSAPLMMGLSVGHSKEPIDPKAPLEEPKRWEVYAVGDIGDVEQDALDVVNRGYRNRTYAGSVGAEYLVSDRLNVGTAFSYADSDTDFAENLGSTDIEGQLGSVYATYFKDQAYVDVLYSYGAFDHDLIRNTGGGNAFGNTDSDAHTFALNAGKNFEYKGLVTGPTVGIDHTTGTIDAYTETGNLPLNFADRDFESTISSLGWQVSKTRKVNSGLFTVQGSASWDHEYQPEGGVTRGTLVADPNVPFNGVGVGPGTDWLNLGLGLRLLTNSGIDLELDYQTQLFREDVTAHYGGLKISTRF